MLSHRMIILWLMSTIIRGLGQEQIWKVVSGPVYHVHVSKMSWLQVVGAVLHGGIWERSNQRQMLDLSRLHMYHYLFMIMHSREVPNLDGATIPALTTLSIFWWIKKPGNAMYPFRFVFRTSQGPRLKIFRTIGEVREQVSYTMIQERTQGLGGK